MLAPDPDPDMQGRPAPRWPPARRRVKRVLDVLLGVFFLVVLGPVMLVVALLVRLSSPGAVLFGQVRIGQHGRPFRMYKFRTMQAGCGDELHREYVAHLLAEDAGASGGLFKLDGDPRITRLGAVLRRSSLDELPQLFNVLRGDMSLVGPRPMLPWELEQLTPAHRARLQVPSGITGLWQVSGRSRLSMRQALELDVEYVRTQSLALDVRILTRTALVLLDPRGSAR